MSKIRVLVLVLLVGIFPVLGQYGASSVTTRGCRHGCTNINTDCTTWATLDSSVPPRMFTAFFDSIANATDFTVRSPVQSDRWLCNVQTAEESEGAVGLGWRPMVFTNTTITQYYAASWDLATGNAHILSVSCVTEGIGSVGCVFVNG